MKWHTPSTIFTILLYLFVLLLSLDRVVVEARVLLGYPILYGVKCELFTV